MAGNYSLIKSAHLSAIADACRAKRKAPNATYTPGELAGVVADLLSDNIDNIYKIPLASGTKMRMRSPSSNAEIDLRGLDVSQVQSFEYMFSSMSAASFNLDGWNAQSLYYVQNMCAGLTMQTIDLACITSSRIYNFSEMFKWASVQNINLQNIITANATNMSNMFSSASIQHVVWNLGNTVQPLKTTPEDAGIGYNDGPMKVYVADEMVETYKAATNWSAAADRIYGISDLPANVRALFPSLPA